MSDNKLKSLDSAGFTLTELIIVVTIMAVTGVAFLAIVMNYMGVITRNNQLSEMTVSSQNVLRTTVEHIRYGDGVRQTNQISDPNAPAGGWNTSNSSFVIILAVPALDSTHNYIIDPDTSNPYMNELVYYKNGSTLMERKLANPSASGNSLKTSCPDNLASAACPADLKLADYVNNMVFTLYDQDGAQTNSATAARSVKITLDMQRPGAGKPLNLTTNIQVTLRNRF